MVTQVIEACRACYGRLRRNARVKKGVLITVGLVVLFSLISGAGTGFLVNCFHRQRRVVSDSERYVEFSRQAQRIGELVGTLDSGFDSLEGNLRAITGELSTGANDLRGLALRLQSTASVVADMEKDILYLRGRLGGFVLNNPYASGTKIDGYNYDIVVD